MDKKILILIEHYDNYSLTAGGHSREIEIFGILGYLDFGFARYLCVLKKREIAASVNSIKIWRITQIAMIPTYRNLSMSLPEVHSPRY